MKEFRSSGISLHVETRIAFLDEKHLVDKEEEPCIANFYVKCFKKPLLDQNIIVILLIRAHLS